MEVRDCNMKMLIIGGQTGLEFSNFVKEASGGSIDIIDKYVSLSTNEQDLKNNLIRADKLIYIISESKNIKNDLRVLNELMINRTYFNVKEMFIFGVSNDSIQEGIKNYKILMSEQGFDNYYINVNPKPMPFNVMYNSIMGIVEEDEQVTKFKKVYRATRSDSSKRGYEPRHYDRIIEPSVKDRVQAYEDIKEASLKAETGRPTRDSDEKYPPHIDIKIVDLDKNDVRATKDILLLTGRGKSGTSSLGTCMARELAIRGDDVVYIDLSYSGGSYRMIKDKIKEIYEVDLFNLMCGERISGDPRVILFSNQNKSLLSECLLYILKYLSNIDYKYIIIDCDCEDLPRIRDLCDNRIIKNIFTCENVEEELKILAECINISKTPNSVLYLNNSIKFDKSCHKPSPVSIADKFPNCKIIKPLDLSKNLKICEALGV